jgi:hypothetical protein
MNPQAVYRSAAAAFLLPLLLCAANAPHFFADDPLTREPQPVDVGKLAVRRLNDWFDFYRNTFTPPGERNERGGPYPAQSVNTLGEVLDSAWYTNRFPLSRAELIRGPGDGNAPDMSGPWQVISAKTQGVTPGFVVLDAKRRRYVLKFDPLTNPEMATAADVVTAKLLWALGYNVPENYIVVFPRSQLHIDDKTKFRDPFGRIRPMKDKDIGEIMLRVPKFRRGDEELIRGVASLYVPGEPIGEFKFYGRRRGDKNDFIPHEHRRELRGLHVFAAWLNHNDSRAINTFDTIVEESGVRYVRHYLLDFGSTLGSAAVRSKSARDGNEYLYAFQPAMIEFITLGLYVPNWARVHYPYYSSLGRIEWQNFEPESWLPNYPNRAFLNRLPDDTFWAAKKLMRLQDDDIRAVVATGQYGDKTAESWLAECLIKRRDKIGQVYFSLVLPIDNFAVRGGRLEWEDLGVKYGFTSNRSYNIRWANWDNESQEPQGIAGATGTSVPNDSGNYLRATIDAGDPKQTVIVHLRRTTTGHQVVGIDRTW